MRFFHFSLSILVCFIFAQFYGFSQSISPSDGKPIQLQHWMTPEEAKLSHLIGKDARATNPPPAPVTNFAEFDRCQSVLIRYQFGITYQLIAAMSQKCRVTTLVASTAEQNIVTNNYINQGVNIANCDFIIAPTNSYWTRDYGPWFIFDGNDEIGIVDFEYNRPRPLDNAIPAKVAQHLGVNYFAIDLKHAGGNYMTDGMGISASTTLVYNENPSYTPAQIAQIFHDYYGINTYHVVPDPNNTYIDHIDCWAKYLAPDKILIRSVPPSHPQYNAIEAAANYFAAQTSSYGTPLQVFRVFTPNNQPYTNSLILNERVFVPIMNSTYDAAAIQTYQQAMPGYEVLGFTGSWQSTDALHCRTIGIADLNMVHIRHMPLLGEQPYQNAYEITATIKAFSGQPLKTDSVRVFYRINNQAWQSVAMTNTGGQQWLGIIPGAAGGSLVQYYIYAVDQANNRNKHPFIGAPDPHKFTIGVQTAPQIYVSPSSLSASVVQGNTQQMPFTLCNNGNAPLIFNISTNTTLTETRTIEIPDSPKATSYQYHTQVEKQWTEINVPFEEKIAAVEVCFNWHTDSWPEEGSLYLESPAGKIATVFNGYHEGRYTIELNTFTGDVARGKWRLWIEDRYGDGGHQVTNVSLKFHLYKDQSGWLAVNPSNGILMPGQCATINVTFNAANLNPGLYNGSIVINSNDPVNNPVIVSVTMTVLPAIYHTQLVPDTLWFTDPSSLLQQPKIVTFTNLSNVPVTLTEIQEQSLPSGPFSWHRGNVSVSLPYQMMPNQSINFEVYVDIPLNEFRYNLQYDSLKVVSTAGIKHLVLACDLDLLASVADLQKNGRRIYPNPFSDQLNIEYYAEQSQTVSISILDGKGQTLVTLPAANGISGIHRITWDGRDERGLSTSPGIYFVRIQKGNQSELIKVLKIR